MEVRVERLAALVGEFRPPSDKSLTHRAYLMSAISRSRCQILSPLEGEDCQSTLACLAQLGATIEGRPGAREIVPAEWREPTSELNCGNSGTTMRLLSGLIASRPIKATLVGDSSLTKRPMKRIGDPLRQMGAAFDGETPPLRIEGTSLRAIDYVSSVASAQVKSCVLLAGLRADGITTITEPALSRDHTERMLEALGVPIKRDGLTVSVSPIEGWDGFSMRIPADISSAAFALVLAALLPGASVVAKQVGINPSRTGILDVLRAVGADCEIGSISSQLNEPVADIHVRAHALHAFTIEGDLVPRLIDEIPVLAVLATQCTGETVIRDAQELRVKESDRISLVAQYLNAMGANIQTREDGMVISGPTPLKGISLEAHGDHRIAMAFFVAGAIADGTTTISGAEAISTSYPNFIEEINKLAN